MDNKTLIRLKEEVKLRDYYFERILKYAKHVGYVKSFISSIILYEDDVIVIKEKLKDLLDKDVRFDKAMYGEK